MNIRIRFFLYLILASILSILLAAIVYMALLSQITLDKILLATIIAVCYFVLFLFIKKDFLKPIIRLQQYSNQYKNQQQIPDNNKNPFNSIAQVMDSLVDESEGLYDDMSDVLKTQIDRLAKKSSILGTLYNISSSLNSIDNIDKLLEHFLQILINMTEANSGVIRLLNNDSLDLTTIIGNIDTKEQVVNINNCICADIAKNDDNYVQFSVHTCAKCIGVSSQIICKYGTIFIPLAHKKKSFGIVSLFFAKTPSLNQDERLLLQTIGDHLAIAIEKDRTEVESKRLIINQQRLFLSQDIHDSLSQILHSLSMQTTVLLDMIANDTKKNTVSKAQDIQEIVQQANLELRKLLYNFRKPISELGLVGDIKNIAKKFQQDNKINTYVHNDGIVDISPEATAQILQISQEALTNINKHACAKNVRIFISKQQLLIEDDGLGFDVSTTKSHSGLHIGLDIIKERAERIGASVKITSEVDEGTQVILDLINIK